jgi:hypothetical protein
MEQHSLFFLFVGTAQTKKANQMFNTVAMRHQDELPFAATDEPKVVALYPGQDPPFVVRVNGTEKPLVLEIDEQKNMTDVSGDVTTWIHENKFALVSFASGANIAELGKSGRLLCAAVCDPSAKQSAGFFDHFLALGRSADPVYAKFRFAIMDGKEDKADEFLASYDVDVNKLPMVVVMELNAKGNELYFNENISRVEQVEGFLQGIANGTVTSQVHGFFGIPDRNWRTLKSFVPLLSVLDFLPVGTFTVTILGLFFYFFCSVLCSDFEDEEWTPPKDGAVAGHSKSD